MSVPRSLCIYCGSREGSDPAYAEATRAFGTLLARRDIRVVYGGGAVGLMGVLADSALAAGGEVTGVIPQALMDREIGHGGLTELCVVASMHERKALMAELADGFVALPGGIGTLEELVEVFTWSQLGIHAKPLGLLDVNGYYRALGRFLDHAVQEGFLRADHRATLPSAAEPEALLDALVSAPAPAPAKWLSADER